MSSGNYILAFAGGLAFGAAGGVFGAKTYFQKKSRKEISEMRAYYAKRSPEPDVNFLREFAEKEGYILREQDKNAAVEENTAYADTFDEGVQEAFFEMGYDHPENRKEYTKLTNQYDPSETMSPLLPYEITEDQFGEYDDYEQITLYYWNNRILTDDQNEPVTDIFGLLGTLEPSQFADGDAIYIRNDQVGADYEILRKLDDFALYKPGGGSV